MNRNDINLERVAEFIEGGAPLDDFHANSINVYRDRDNLISICEDMKGDPKADELAEHIRNIDFDDKIAHVYSWALKKKGKIVGNGPMAIQLHEDSIVYHSNTTFADNPSVISIDEFEDILKKSFEREERQIKKTYSFSDGVINGDKGILDFLSDKIKGTLEEELEDLAIRKERELESYNGIKEEYSLKNELKLESTPDNIDENPSNKNTRSNKYNR